MPGLNDGFVAAVFPATAGLKAPRYSVEPSSATTATKSGSRMQSFSAASTAIVVDFVIVVTYSCETENDKQHNRADNQFIGPGKLEQVKRNDQHANCGDAAKYGLQVLLQ